MKSRHLGLCILAFGLNPATAAPCDEDFGKHPPPPRPIISPQVEDLPFGKFKWGTEAYLDPSGYWWVGDGIWNAHDAPPLAVSWNKGDIHRALNFPFNPSESQ
jgi:hypothetical protein